jgi:hypothetical protein
MMAVSGAFLSSFVSFGPVFSFWCISFFYRSDFSFGFCAALCRLLVPTRCDFYFGRAGSRIDDLMPARVEYGGVLRSLFSNLPLLVRRTAFFFPSFLSFDPFGLLILPSFSIHAPGSVLPFKFFPRYHFRN